MSNSEPLDSNEPSWSFVNVPDTESDVQAEDTADVNAAPKAHVTAEPKSESGANPQAAAEPAIRMGSEGLRSRIPGAFVYEPGATPSTASSANPTASRARPESSTTANSGPTQSQTPGPGPDAQRRNPNRVYQPRTCRICLEVVQPTFHPPNPSLPRIFQSTGYVTYESEDPSSGRLIRPCKCKGSSRYVHEACLQQWRYADPSFGNRNYWTCPTCGFKYRLQRMTWGRWINNVCTQIMLTLLIFLVTIFILGFVADPIINLWADPYDTLTTGDFSRDLLRDDENEDLGWLGHLFKGVLGLGVLGIMKVAFFTPFEYFRMRQTGLMNTGMRGRNTGRDRMSNISMIVIVVGVGTFLWAVYKAVRAWSRRTLEKASERVMDVPLDDDEEEERAEPATAH